MPKVEAGKLTMNYEQQGTGEPLILLPYLAADHACYAFQVGEYAKYFSCISVELRRWRLCERLASRLRSHSQALSCGGRPKTVR